MPSRKLNSCHAVQRCFEKAPHHLSALPGLLLQAVPNSAHSLDLHASIQNKDGCSPKLREKFSTNDRQKDSNVVFRRFKTLSPRGEKSIFCIELDLLCCMNCCMSTWKIDMNALTMMNEWQFRSFLTNTWTLLEERLHIVTEYSSTHRRFRPLVQNQEHLFDATTEHLAA